MVLGIIPNTKFVYSLGHPLKGCLFYFPNFAGYCPGSRYLANGKKSEGELAHSCEGRCSPSDSPLSATLKRSDKEKHV